jgi:GNAT superfamily N-acetyltransferase
MKIRAASVQTDLPAIIDLIQPYEPLPLTIEQVRGWFEYLPEGRITRRLVAVGEAGQISGYSVILHSESDPPGRYYVWQVVHPGLRRQGIGSVLWSACQEFLKEQGAGRLSSEVGDQDAVGLVFARQRGFEIDRHIFASFLDLTTFDDSSVLPLTAALEAQGLRFCSFADFPDTPENRRKLYDLNASTALDIPGVDSMPWTFEGFVHSVLQAPWFDPHGQLLAVDGDTWAGMAPVSLDKGTRTASNLYTGVRREYRGRKLAQALKVLAARYAREHGALKIRTDNDSQNVPILAINRKMGYQPLPGKYILVRK